MGALLAGGLLIVSVLGVLAAPWLVYVLAAGFSETPGKVELTAEMIRIVFPYILFVSLVSLAGGILNVYRQFAIPAFTPVLLNLSIIGAALFLAPYCNPPIVALAWGVAIGGVAQLAFQIRPLWKIGMLPRWSFDWRDEGVRRVLIAMGPAVIGVSAAQISALINTQLAAALGDGRISWITYADRLMEFPSALLGVALGTVLLPSLAKHHADANPQQYSALLDWGLRLAFLLALPAAVALWVLAVPLISTLYQYGHFTVHDVFETRAALLGYSVGLLGLILVKILAPGFYARQIMKTPVKIAFVTVLVSQTLAVILMQRIGHAGLTLATSIGACLNAALLFRSLRTRGIYRPQSGWLLFVSKLVVALVALAALLAWIAGPPSLWLEASLVDEGRASRVGVCGAERASISARCGCSDSGSPTSIGARVRRESRSPCPTRSRTSGTASGVAARLAIRTARLHALGVEIERVLSDLEAAIAGDLVLPLLDLRVVELLDAAALQADEVIVVAALVQLEHRLARLEMVADEEPGLLELRQHPIDGREADVEALGQQLSIDVLGGQVTDLRRFEQVDDLEPRHRGLEAGMLEVVRGHRGALRDVAAIWRPRQRDRKEAESRPRSYNSESPRQIHRLVAPHSLPSRARLRRGSPFASCRARHRGVACRRLLDDRHLRADAALVRRLQARRQSGQLTCRRTWWTS